MEVVLPDRLAGHWLMIVLDYRAVEMSLPYSVYLGLIVVLQRQLALVVLEMGVVVVAYIVRQLVNKLKG
jgi:hypothetical protein